MVVVDLDSFHEVITINDELERYALLQVAGEQLSIAVQTVPFTIITDKRINKVIAVLSEIKE